jgi:Short-chain alcohol dehydrogenase of unknown specificity
MVTDRVGWLTNRRCAAAVMLRSSKTATKAASCRISIGIPDTRHRNKPFFRRNTAQYTSLHRSVIQFSDSRRIPMSKPLIIVTGASSGIGEATARLFSQQGHPLLLLARRIDRLEALQLPNALCRAVDVTDRETLLAAVAEAEERSARLTRW